LRRELGYIEGQTIRLEYRAAEWQLGRLPSLAAELVRLKPDVLVTNTTPAALAAKQATATVPSPGLWDAELTKIGDPGLLREHAKRAMADKFTTLSQFKT
jgi:hypothetical protein